LVAVAAMGSVAVGSLAVAVVCYFDWLLADADVAAVAATAAFVVVVVVVVVSVAESAAAAVVTATADSVVVAVALRLVVHLVAFLLHMAADSQDLLSAALMTSDLQSEGHLQTDFSLHLAAYLENPTEMNVAGLPFLVILPINTNTWYIKLMVNTSDIIFTYW